MSEIQVANMDMLAYHRVMENMTTNEIRFAIKDATQAMSLHPWWSAYYAKLQAELDALRTEIERRAA